MMRLTPSDISARKKGGTPIVCLTAYTTPMAKMLDPHVDLLLVGDSVGMVLYGMENTLGVDLDTMIRHGQAVMRGATQSCVIVDMPFGSYEDTPDQALRNATRIMQETGCDGVKIEGGEDMADTIAHLTTHGIPVMAHIGLQPQSVVKEGGYKIKGRDSSQEKQLTQDALAIADAGAFCVVIEGVVHDVAERLSQAITIPTIGIGASAMCDGQILVSEDMMGLHDGHIPKFVKQYDVLHHQITEASQRYAHDVRARAFPSPEYVYMPKKTGS